MKRFFMVCLVLCAMQTVKGMRDARRAMLKEIYAYVEPVFILSDHMCYLPVEFKAIKDSNSNSRVFSDWITNLDKTRKELLNEVQEIEQNMQAKDIERGQQIKGLLKNNSLFSIPGVTRQKEGRLKPAYFYQFGSKHQGGCWNRGNPEECKKLVKDLLRKVEEDNNRMKGFVKKNQKEIDQLNFDDCR